MEGFKLDINIPQKKVEEMAKQVIREIIESKIQEAMKNINIEKTITDKINRLDTRLSKLVNDTVKKSVQDMKYDIQYKMKDAARAIILEEMQKKPLTGNIYLKIDDNNVETDYDNYDDY